MQKDDILNISQFHKLAGNIQYMSQRLHLFNKIWIDSLDVDECKEWSDPSV